MARIAKIQIRMLLITELVIGFAPLTVLVVVGLFISAFQVLFLIVSEDARDHPAGSLEVILLSLLGLFALVSFINLVLTTISSRKPFFGRKTTIVFGTIGLAALIYLIGDSETMAWRLIFLAPLLIALHFIYLGRAFLFPDSAGHHCQE